MTRRSTFKKAVTAIVILVAIDAALNMGIYSQLGHNVYKERYYSWFGLSASSTVLDYRGSSPGVQSWWLDRMCDDGVCLHPVDWKCGFSLAKTQDDHIAEEEATAFGRNTRQCFLALIQKAPLVETLGKLRVLCGRRYMVFAGELYSKPQECREAGGEWGKKAVVFGDEKTYFEDQ